MFSILVHIREYISGAGDNGEAHTSSLPFLFTFQPDEILLEDEEFVLEGASVIKRGLRLFALVFKKVVHSYIRN